MDEEIKFDWSQKPFFISDIRPSWVGIAPVSSLLGGRVRGVEGSVGEKRGWVGSGKMGSSVRAASSFLARVNATVGAGLQKRTRSHQRRG